MSTGMFLRFEGNEQKGMCIGELECGLRFVMMKDQLSQIYTKE